MQTDRRDIHEWFADTTYQGEVLAANHNPIANLLEVDFPRRKDIDNPERTIDALLGLHCHPQWPKFRKPIARESAERIVYAVCVADALHEIVESVKIDGERPLCPHPDDGPEDDMWDLLLDLGQMVARRLVKEHPRVNA